MVNELDNRIMVGGTEGPTETDERFRSCTSCGSAHLAPVPCHMTFRQRLATVRIDPRAMETRRRNYWDQAALDEQFGPDAEEAMWDATDGLGAGYRDEQGRLMRRDRYTGEPTEMTPADARRIIERHSTQVGELEPGESPETWEAEHT